MKIIYILLASLFLIAACNNDLDQFPPNLADANSLTEFDRVLNAAYFYQHASVTPMAVMGDFRADNALMIEEPYPEFDRFTAGLNDGTLQNQFFAPFYAALYNAILSTNTVIENSSDATQVGEARFLRALSYFKLVRVFGDVPVNTLASANPFENQSILERQPAANVYNNVIIPDLQAAMSALSPEKRDDGRATRYAAQGLLGKVYVQMGDFTNAESHLAAVVNGAAAAGFSLESNFAGIFGEANELDNTEIIFATRISGSIVDEYPDSEFWEWYIGNDTKSLEPLDPDLVAAFDAVAVDTLSGGDLRRPVTINAGETASSKYPATNGADHDWIELRLADVILLYAETLNENGTAAETVLDLLDPIRARAGLTALDHTVLNTQALVRQAIQDERRLELAFEGQRWFDLVRTGTVNAEIGETVDSRYYLFPIPPSEVTASFGVITQNPGY